MIGMNIIRYAETKSFNPALGSLTSLSIVGSVLVYVCKSVGARYAGLILMGVYSTAMPIAMTIISSNVGGFTKKATVSAVFFILYCVGNIIGPQLFFEYEAPKYQVRG